MSTGSPPRPFRVVLLVVGSIVTLVALAVLAAGAVALGRTRRSGTPTAT